MMEQPHCPKCNGEVYLGGTESYICAECGYWENSFGEEGVLDMNDKLGKICVEIYKECYEHAEPKADFLEMWQTGKVNRMTGLKYYLPSEKFDEIYLKHTQGLSAKEKMKVTFEVCINYAPTTVKA